MPLVLYSSESCSSFQVPAMTKRNWTIKWATSKHKLRVFKLVHAQPVECSGLTSSPNWAHRPKRKAQETLICINAFVKRMSNQMCLKVCNYPGPDPLYIWLAGKSCLNFPTQSPWSPAQNQHLVGWPSLVWVTWSMNTPLPLIITMNTTGREHGN